MMKWLVFFALAIALAISAAATDSRGAEYDYPGQVYAAITAGQCYDTAGEYDPDCQGPAPAQEVPVESCFVKGMSTGDQALRKGWLHNKYLGVILGGGSVTDITPPPLPFAVTTDALILIAGEHWFTYAISHDLVRSSKVGEECGFGPQILRYRIP